MGDPKKLRKKYDTPVHPWNKNVIEEERKLKVEYGLNNKREILIANSFLKKYMNIAKRLIATQSSQGEKEKEQVLRKLQDYGLLQQGSELGEVLGLDIKDILERRLQSLVYRKSLARSMKQARQFIVHRHVTVNNKEITSPSYLLSLTEEAALGFKTKSALASEEHPERAIAEKVPEAPVEEKKSSEKEESVVSKETEVKKEAVSVEEKKSEAEEPAIEEKPADEEKSTEEKVEKMVEEVKKQEEKQATAEDLIEETKDEKKPAEEIKKEEAPNVEVKEE